MERSGQMQLLQQPLPQKLKQVEIRFLFGRDTTEVMLSIQTLRGRLDKSICSPNATSQEVDSLKDELNQAYLWRKKYFGNRGAE